MSAQPVEFYAVVRPPSEWTPKPTPYIAESREHAEAIRVCKQHEFPESGPFRVVRLVEAET